jgi:Recombinase zinc beta ribbon domain
VLASRVNGQVAARGVDTRFLFPSFLSRFIKDARKHAISWVDMESTTKWLKFHFFYRSLSVIGTEVRVSERRRIWFAAGELLDLKQRNSRGDQARAISVAQIVIAKRRPQIRFLHRLFEPQAPIGRALVALRRVENLLPWRALSQARQAAPHSMTSSYLFSGLLKCGECCANLIIATGGGTHRHNKYACSRRFNRGGCENNLYIRRDDLEDMLLDKLQNGILQPEVVDYAVTEFQRQLEAALGSLPDDLTGMRQRKTRLEAEVRRLVSAVAESGHSKSLLEEIGR